MECPECGADVDGSANFCPMCRHRFQESLDLDDSDAAPETEQATVTSSPEPSTDQDPDRFSGKELQYLKVQLIQPSMLLIAAVAITGYFSVPQVQTITIIVRDTPVPAGGAISLLAGIIVGGLFYAVMAARLARFR